MPAALAPDRARPAGDLDVLTHRGATIQSANYGQSANQNQTARDHGLTDHELRHRLRRTLFRVARSAALCGLRIPRDDDGNPGVASIVKAGDNARIAGIFRCNNPCCPTCGPRLARHRTAVLDRQLDALKADDDGVNIMHLTLTHRPFGLMLADEVVVHDAVVVGFLRSLRGTLGYVCGRDVTFAGKRYERHHLHRHLVIVAPAGADIGKLEVRLIKAWLRHVRRAGGHAVEEAQHARVEGADDDDGAFYAVSGHVRPGDEDGDGTTLRDLQVLAARGDRRAAWRLQEYVGALSGRRSVTAGGKLTLTEPAPDVDADEIEIVQFDASVLATDAQENRLSEVVQEVAKADDGGAAKMAAHRGMMERFPGGGWRVYWQGHEDEFYGTPEVYEYTYPVLCPEHFSDAAVDGWC